MTLYPKAGMDKPHGPGSTLAGRKNPAGYVLPYNTNLEAWYDASTITGLATTDPIVTWSDLSGNARTLASAATKYPLYTTGASPSGLPAARFDGTNDYMTISATGWGTALTQPNTIFVVSKRIAGAGIGCVVAGPGTTRHNIYYWEGLKFWGYYSGASVQSTVETWDNDWHYLRVVFNSTSSTFHVDGSAVTIGGNTGAQTLDGLTLGIDGDDLTSFPLNADIGEVLVYSEAVSAPNITLIEAYLAGKWGI